MAGLSNLVWHTHCFAGGNTEKEDTRYDACEDKDGNIFVWCPRRNESIRMGFEKRIGAVVFAQTLADKAGCIGAE